jgi:hypothetical protein
MSKRLLAWVKNTIGVSGFNTTLSTTVRDTPTKIDNPDTTVQQVRDTPSFERGRNKHKYHHRKVFWDQVLKMVNLQIAATAELAIDAIYGKYGGHLTVTQILNKMKVDRATQEGIHI